jgi:hypothetical protein
MVTVFIPSDASPVERYAAGELRKYLAILYHLDAPICGGYPAALAGPAIVIGDPRDHAGLASSAWPELSADGFCLRTVRSDPPVLVVAGGSGRGVLFGVYELVERWGVRFLLSGDVLPEQPEPLRLTGFDECLEPAYPLRAMRPMANLPEGSAAWSLADFTGFIDQMAKLKFNTFAFVIMESGPWLDYEFRGLERPAGDIFYGYRFPIDDDFVGQELFAGQSEFYSPVLAPARNDEERKRFGIGLVRAIIAHCKSRDLLTLLIFPLLEPPTALKHACNEWASLPLPDPKSLKGAHFTVTPVEEFGINPQYAAWMNVLDPVVRELTAHRLKALINTYPEADFYHLWVSEHRAEVGDSRAIFRALDEKYHLSPEFDWDQALEDFATSPFDRERYQNQMKGDLLFASAMDAILNENELLRQTAKPAADIGIIGVMPQLAPLMIKMLPAQATLGQFLDYGAHGVAERIERLTPLLRAAVPTTLEIGIHDDNDMYFPQVSVESLERIVNSTAALGMKGCVVSHWQVRQADINAAFLSRALWHPGTTAAGFYSEFAAQLVGPAAADDFEQACRLIEGADRQVRKSMLYGYAFPMTEGLLKAFVYGRAADRDRQDIQRIQPQFQAACERFVAARAKSSPGGRPYVDFWTIRTQFAVAWLDLALACADLGTIMGTDLQPGAALAPECRQAALSAVDGLVERSRSLIQRVVNDAKHIGDLGQIANLNQHVYRCLRGVRAEVAGRAEKGL